MTDEGRAAPGHRGGWFRHLRARPRWAIAGGIFLALLVILLMAGKSFNLALLTAFDAAAISFLVSIAHLFARSDSKKMKLRARAQAPGRWAVLWSSVIVAGTVLVALAIELGKAHDNSTWGVVAACGSLLLTWLFFNTMFAMHYAYDYYMCNNGSERLQFPGTKEPDYWDFLYFAAVIGMCFQVSDVQIADQYLRRTALGQSVIAFFFNVVIIAITVNVVASRA
ncbi:DUF1345 domain-containing protein [Pinirhizobacter sp.]|uniref:DUF1345 domain-containing protein n=1 Tax=Pinirhizobacter sp. TaxID=2950432 RepID=UPI002F3E886E